MNLKGYDVEVLPLRNKSFENYDPNNRTDSDREKEATPKQSLTKTDSSRRYTDIREITKYAQDILGQFGIYPQYSIMKFF